MCSNMCCTGIITVAYADVDIRCEIALGGPEALLHLLNQKASQGLKKEKAVECKDIYWEPGSHIKRDIINSTTFLPR